jgi:hypothetical protein
LAEELARAPAPIVPPEPANIAERPIDQRQQPARRAPRPPSAPPAAPTAPPAAAADAQFNSSADQNLAEMAQRLEAALRRPVKADDARPPAQSGPRVAPEPASTPAETDAPPPLPPARSAPSDMPRVVRAGPARTDAKPATPKSLYDSLEQEMASLLGRPNTKP